MKIGGILIYSLLGGGLVASVTYNVMMNRMLGEYKTEIRSAREAAVRTPEKTVPEKPATPPPPQQASAEKSVPQPSKVPDAPTPREVLAESSNYEQWEHSFNIWYPVNIQSVSDVELAKKITITPAVEFTVSSSGSRVYIRSGQFKPGTVYRISVKPGIAPLNPFDQYGRLCFYPSTREQSFAFLMPDLSPELGFISNCSIYPLHAPIRELPVRAVNAGKSAKIFIYEIYPNQRFNFLSQPNCQDSYSNPYGKEILEKEFPLRLVRNEQAALGLEFQKIGLPEKPGVFLLKMAGQKSEISTATLVVTDLVMQSVSDAAGSWFLLHSISTGQPVSGAKISFISEKNQTLSTGVTDADGKLFMNKASLRPNDADDSLAMALAEKDGDITYLRLNTAIMPVYSTLPRETVNGDQDFAMVWPNVNICRPGENITLFAMLRSGEKRLARTGVPVDLVVSSDSSPFKKRIPAVTDDSGCVRADFSIPLDSPLCTYSAILLPRGADEKKNDAFGKTTFSVNEFIPDELKSTLSARLDNDTLSASGKVTYYFGVPLQGGKVSGAVCFETKDYHSKRYEKYEFCAGLPNHSDSDAIIQRTTDRDGAFSFEKVIPIPAKENQGRPVVYYTQIYASGNGGRGITAQSESIIRHFAPFYVGLREDSENKNGKTFAVAIVDPQDRDTAAPGLRCSVMRLDWDYVITENLRYVWQEKKIEHRAPAPLEIKDGKFTVPLNQPGRYTVLIKDADGNLFAEKSFWFDAGESGSHSADPNNLVFLFDREKAQPGDTVTVSFDSPVAGKGIVTTGAAKIAGFSRFDVKKGRNEVKITVPADTIRGAWHAGFTIVGKTDPNDLNQIRLTSVASIPVDQNTHKIMMALDAPEKARPEETVRVKLTLKNTSGAPASGRVQLWGVDRGILSLTGFKTPDPFQFFFGAYACPLVFRDSYDDIYNLFKLDRKAIGGGEDGSIRSDYMSGQQENRKKAVVFVLDSVAVPASGEAVVSVRLPKHTGAMRLMAIASSPDKTGSAEREIIMRDDISLKVAAPRVAAPGDEFAITFDAFNHELADGQAVWTVDALSGASPTGEKTGSFELKKGASAAGSFRLKANADVENVRCRVNLTLGTRTLSEDVAVTVRAPLPEQAFCTVGTLDAGKKTFTAGKKEYLEIGSPALSISGALDFLAEYPYGCLEQTTSAAFPFLAVKPLADAGLLDRAFSADAQTKIESAVRRLAEMHYLRMSFVMWPGERNNWQRVWEDGSCYACHFLLEAAAAGYTVPEPMLNGIREGLVNKCGSNGTPAGVRAYCTYILSLTEPAQAAAYAELQLTDKNLRDYSRFLLAATLVRGGNAALGMPILKDVIKQDFYLENDPGLSLIDSIPRRLGLALWILADILPDAPENTRLADAIRRRMLPNGNWGSTQNNAWCALGISRWYAKQRAAAPVATVTVNGKTEKLDGSLRIAAGQSATVEVQSGSLIVFDRKRSVPKSFQPESVVFQVSKIYLNDKGQPVVKAKHGELLTVVLTISSGKPVENLVLCDLLPGGLEIEDETLLSRFKVPDQSADDISSSGLRIRLKERRFDRFLLFGDIRETTAAKPAVVTYHVRAAVRGKFAVPPVQVEAMYEPEPHATARPAEVFEIE